MRSLTSSRSPRRSSDGRKNHWDQDANRIGYSRDHRDDRTDRLGRSRALNKLAVLIHRDDRYVQLDDDSNRRVSQRNPLDHRPARRVGLPDCGSSTTSLRAMAFPNVANCFTNRTTWSIDILFVVLRADNTGQVDNQPRAPHVARFNGDCAARALHQPPAYCETKPRPLADALRGDERFE